MLLPKDKVYGIITFQLGKAATSLGSNYEEAQGAESSKDFNHKIGIVLKEARESNFWLRVLNAISTDYEKNNETKRLQNEGLEFKKIFSAIKIKTDTSSKKKSN